jgi:lysozyme family protein
MAATNRKASFLATMNWEGRDRLSMDPRDPGNWTGGKVGIGHLIGSKYGVSAMTCARMFPGKRILDLTIDDALKVFVDGYWTPIGADALAPGVDHCVADDAYNAGPGAALGRWRRGGFAAEADPVATIHAYSERRLSFLEALRTWKLYAAGWARRVAGVEAESIVMAHAAGAKLKAATLADHLTDTSHEAGDKASAAFGRAVLSGAVAIAVPVAAPHGGLALLAAFGAAAVAALHQIHVAHVAACRRDALGDAAEAA